MSLTVFPRSDAINAKVIQPSDWKDYFQDVIQDYIVSGLEIIQGGASLIIKVGEGTARLGGLVIRNTAELSYTLSANETTYLYFELGRDSHQQVDSVVLTATTTEQDDGDFLLLAKLVTDDFGVTEYDGSGRVEHGNGAYGMLMGHGADGGRVVSGNEILNDVRAYSRLTIEEGATLTVNTKYIFVSGALEVKGTILPKKVNAVVYGTNKNVNGLVTGRVRGQSSNNSYSGTVISDRSNDVVPLSFLKTDIEAMPPIEGQFGGGYSNTKSGGTVVIFASQILFGDNGKIDCSGSDGNNFIGGNNNSQATSGGSGGYCIMVYRRLSGYEASKVDISHGSGGVSDSTYGQAAENADDGVEGKVLRLQV